jgi:SNF2 family DNA or RNA helicase
MPHSGSFPSVEGNTSGDLGPPTDTSTGQNGFKNDRKQVADAWAEFRSSGISSQRFKRIPSSVLGLPPFSEFDISDQQGPQNLEMKVSGMDSFLPCIEPSASGTMDEGLRENTSGETNEYEEHDLSQYLQHDFRIKMDDFVNLDGSDDCADYQNCYSVPTSAELPSLSKVLSHTSNPPVNCSFDAFTGHSASALTTLLPAPETPQLTENVIDVDDPETDTKLALAARYFNGQGVVAQFRQDVQLMVTNIPPQPPVIEIDEDIVCIASDEDEDRRPTHVEGQGIPEIATAGEIFGGGGVYSTHTTTRAWSRNGRNSDHEYDKVAIKKLVEFNNLSADATEEIANPPELTVELLRHQKRAVAWMVKREQLGTRPVVDPVADDVMDDYDGDDDEMNSAMSDIAEPCRGGILADEQGLGKTLSIITLLLVNPPPQIGNERSKWRTLVICPVSLVGQWKDEIERRIDSKHRRSVYIYHGPKRTRSASELASYDVVISTYTTITNEYPKLLKDDPMYAIAKKAKTPLPRRPGGPIFQCKWYRVVLDEAHNIKNRRTEGWAAANQLPAENRWCLTGTPIQNSVDDIYSLFCFIRYRFMAINNYKTWNETWKKKLESNSAKLRERAFQRFQAIVGVVTLRRTKKETIDGKPLVTIPDRSCEIREVAFGTPREIAFYKAVEKDSIVELRKFASAGGLRQNYSGIMVLLLRMRQACCHPHLIEYTAAKVGTDYDDDLEFYSPYSASKLDETRQLMEAGESSFAALSESVQEAVIIKLAPPHDPDEPRDEKYQCDCCSQFYMSDSLKIIPTGMLACRSCIANITNEYPSCKQENDPFLELDDVRCEVHVKVRDERRRNRETMWKLKSSACSKKSNLDEVGFCQHLVGQPPLKKLKSDEDLAVCTEIVKTEKALSGVELPSTKIVIILDVLRAMRERSADEKCLIFSQWTSMMDIIAYHLDRAGFLSCRLDGSMSMARRKDEIEKFKSDKNCTVFLISMHAGGTGTLFFSSSFFSHSVLGVYGAFARWFDVRPLLTEFVLYLPDCLYYHILGLNLTEASNVILADVWWNPSVEEQCCDRAHRIGQRKTVRITRLKIAGTVEERIYEMCKRKAELCKGALGAEGSQSLGRQKMTLEDALSLFGDVADNIAHSSGVDDVARQAAEDIGRLIADGGRSI